MHKKTITVRFVFERDFEVDCKKEGKDGRGDYSCNGDDLVCSGYDMWEQLTHESIFDNPVSNFRPVNGFHWADANLYNVQSGSHSYAEILPWLSEGETDIEYNFEEIEDDE